MGIRRNEGEQGGRGNRRIEGKVGGWRLTGNGRESRLGTNSAANENEDIAQLKQGASESMKRGCSEAVEVAW